MATTLMIPPEILPILTQCTITAERVYLPQIQFPRPTYLALNKVLEAAGGKWNKALQCHVFARDPRPFLCPALETGTVTRVQQTLQAFYTPPAVAQQVIALADLDPGHRILEPSAGLGALALEAATIVPKSEIFCVDSDAYACEQLESLGFPWVFCVDFLSITDLIGGQEGQFDRVLMNPPFANGADMAHIQHAHTFLKPGGRLVSVVPAMTGNKSRKKTEKAFRAFLDQHLLQRIELPKGSFGEAGTQVATSILVIGA